MGPYYNLVVLVSLCYALTWLVLDAGGSSHNVASNMIPGRSCGTLTPFRHVDTLPTELDLESEDFANAYGCTFVKDSAAMERYWKQQPS